MNKDEIIIKTCPHVSYTDYGVWACKLYKPRDKNSFVKFGTCGANKTCPYKIAELKTQECEKYIKVIEKIEKMMTVCLHKGNCLECPYSDKCENPFEGLVYEPSRGVLEIIFKIKNQKGTKND